VGVSFRSESERERQVFKIKKKSKFFCQSITLHLFTNWTILQRCFHGKNLFSFLKLNNLSKMGRGGKIKEWVHAPCSSTRGPALLVLDRYRFCIFSSDFENFPSPSDLISTSCPTKNRKCPTHE
jgi:hypothetical protein